MACVQNLVQNLVGSAAILEKVVRKVECLCRRVYQMLARLIGGDYHQPESSQDISGVHWHGHIIAAAS